MVDPHFDSDEFMSPQPLVMAWRPPAVKVILATICAVLFCIAMLQSASDERASISNPGSSAMISP